jgi:ABC-type Fe3+ transport system permease subunit
MAEVASVDGSRPFYRWILWTLYAVLAVAAAALLVLLVGEIVYSFEDPDEHETHSHGFYGPIFDGAWFVFLPAALATLIGGVIALPVGWFRGSAPTRRYGARAIGFCVLSIAVVALAESFV